MKNLLSTLFSFQGRTTRTVWWISAIVWWAFVAISAHLDTSISGKEEPSALFTVAILASFWPMLAIQAKRWHDRNKSALWILIGVIPIIGGIWGFVELGFLGPVDEGNGY